MKNRTVVAYPFTNVRNVEKRHQLKVRSKHTWRFTLVRRTMRAICAKRDSSVKPIWQFTSVLTLVKSRSNVTIARDVLSIKTAKNYTAPFILGSNGMCATDAAIVFQLIRHFTSIGTWGRIPAHWCQSIDFWEREKHQQIRLRQRMWRNFNLLFISV